MIDSEAEVVLSRVQCSHENDYFCLRIDDKPSSRRLVEIRLTDSELANLMSTRVASGPMRYFESDSTLGRQVEVDVLEFEVVGASCHYPEEEAIEQLAGNTPEGWTADASFTSQGSFEHRDGKTFAKTRIRRWVEKSDG